MIISPVTINKSSLEILKKANTAKTEKRILFIIIFLYEQNILKKKKKINYISKNKISGIFKINSNTSTELLLDRCYSLIFQLLSP